MYAPAGNRQPTTASHVAEPRSRILHAGGVTDGSRRSSEATPPVQCNCTIFGPGGAGNPACEARVPDPSGVDFL
jgi:hypothetical protein